MKKIGVIVRASPRDFSSTRAAIHPFQINGKIARKVLVARGREYPKAFLEYFPNIFLMRHHCILVIQRFESLHIQI